MTRKLVLLSLILVLVAAGPLVYFLQDFSPIGFHHENGLEESNGDDSVVSPSVESTPFVPADSVPATGVIDPVLIEQAGYIESENLSARTDTGVNTTYSLDIDSGNDWIGSVAEVDLWNLKKLYAVNGTFDEGIPGSNQDPTGSVSNYPYGWSATSADADTGMTQFAEYIDQGQTFITVENQGQDLFGNSYRHHGDPSSGTYVVWYQTINNYPFTDDFILNLDYLYYRGPIDKPGGDSVSGSVVMFVQFAGITVWSQSLPSIESRGVWFNTGDIVLTNMSVGSSFTFYVGIYFSSDVTLSAGSDYDNDGAADGIANAASIAVQFDNIELSGQNEPDFSQVDLQFIADGTSVPITGSNGIGNASVPNPSIWSVGPIDVEITSNDTVFFEYQTRLLSHRFINSSYSTDTSLEGTAYSIRPNKSPLLNLYTYIGTVDPYQDFVVNIEFPNDWENVTVSDPFLNNVTSQCSLILNTITIPTSLVNRLGWWELSFDSPNYLKTLKSQIFNTTSSNWEEVNEFRSSNKTRVSMILGTATEVPELDDDTVIQWYYPNQTQWAAVSVSGGIGGQLYSAAKTFGPTNTSAGLWTVTAFWSNGTELAYGQANFSLIHRAQISAVQSNLEVEVGVVVSNFITFTDSDNGEIIVTDDATITANWSGSIVTFTPDQFKNWYEADFDTSIVGGGVFIVNVNATLDYFDCTNTSFLLGTEYRTKLEITNIGELPEERGLEEEFQIHFQYEVDGGSGIFGADIDVSYSSTFDGLEENQLFDYGNGTYTLSLTVNTSDTYSITIFASKTYYQSSSDSFTIIVDNIATNVIRLNGTADAIKFGDTYRLVTQYRNSTGTGLSGALAKIVSITPSSGLENSSFGELPDGYYEITLTPIEADVFTIVLQFQLANHETQFTTFTLTVSEISTTLSAQQSSFSVAFDQVYTVNLYLQDDNLNGLQNAIIEIVNLPSGLEYTSFTDWMNGSYSILLTPIDVGTYDLLFKSYLKNYQNSTETTSLLVTLIPTEIDFVDSISISYQESVDLMLFYNRSDLGSAISNANITLSGYSPEFIHVDIFESLGYYTLTIKGLQLGISTLRISASQTGYRNAEIFFTLEILELETDVEGSNPAEQLTFGREILLNFSYLLESNQSSIYRANVTAFGEAAGWVSLSESENGQYSITLIPQDIGNHEVVLLFERYGYESKSFRLTFTVGPAPIEVNFISGLTGLEESELELLIELRTTDTDEPVSGAFVRYLITGSQGFSTDFITMTESNETLGIYSALLIMPNVGGIYTLEIFVELDDYELTQASSTELTPETNFSILFARTVRDNSLLFIILTGVVVGLIARQVNKRKQIRENIEALAVKKRFDDVRNLLGVIVLHKSSGLPLYSRIIRGGVDESIIAAFITAIRNFREEFDIENGVDEDKIVPISDIIRVITTENLVIAFITLQNPSSAQKNNMITFARKVGMVFDTVYHVAPLEVLDNDTKQSLNILFEEILDGVLALNYRLADDEKLTGDSECFTEQIPNLPGEVFKLDNLATALATCGITEAKAYKMIADALDSGVIILTDESITTPEDEFVAEVESLLVNEDNNDNNNEDSEDE